jgi:uncharacterized membrane protein YeaQ/YmgE (transglycosylase-associated protein family)
MDGLLEVLGVIGLVLLVVIGLLAGLIASVVSGGRNKGRYMVTGVLAALAAPFLLALIGLGVIAAYGIAAILVAAVIGAVVVLLVVRLLSGDDDPDRRDDRLR